MKSEVDFSPRPGCGRLSLARGRRADVVMLDLPAPALPGRLADHRLDEPVFPKPGAALDEVFLAGWQVVALGGPGGRGQHAALSPELVENFSRAMREIRR